MFANDLKTAWNRATGDQKRKDEIRSLVNQAIVVLRKKSRLLGACDAYDKSPSKDNWKSVRDNLSDTNQAFKDFKSSLDDQIETHPAGPVTSQLVHLRASVMAKGTSLCLLASEPSSPEERKQFKATLARMKQQDNAIRTAMDDLTMLVGFNPGVGT